MIKLVRLPIVMAMLTVALSSFSLAKDIRVRLPKRSKPTPVQAYNQDGVKAIQKHDYTKAKKLFYRAYLIDPNDPFTLNNLGYVAELDGDIDRAQRFYELAAQQNSEATVDRASLEEAKGQTVAAVAGHAEFGSMKVNTVNVRALGLLTKDRAAEADLMLQKALKLDPHNPFTLNNLGFARELQGELESSLQYYTAAANTRSEEPIIVAIKSDWRGRKISEVAADNARKVQDSLRNSEDLEAKVARLNLRGVSALNRNDRPAARQYFQQAYKIAPDDAFTLNNMGYVAEMEGDKETADMFYAKAKEAGRATATVTVASRKEAEGRRLNDVADKSGVQVYSAMEASAEVRRQRGGPAVLKKRDDSVVTPRERPKVQEESPLLDQPPADQQPPMPTSQIPGNDNTDPVPLPKETPSSPTPPKSN